MTHPLAVAQLTPLQIVKRAREYLLIAVHAKRWEDRVERIGFADAQLAILERLLEAQDRGTVG